MLIAASMLVLAGSTMSLAAWPGHAIVVEVAALAFAGSLFTAICAVEARG
ncbi:MAG TPA: hypothetical protein VHL98_00785 [Microvirga sp.]|jgi:hypothetical protein|nr:hypothetical protein [Microvirga sp.]